MQRTRHVSSSRERDIQGVVTELQHEDADDDMTLDGLSTLNTLNNLRQLPGNARPCQSALAHRPLFSPQVRSCGKAAICMQSPASCWEKADMTC